MLKNKKIRNKSIYNRPRYWYHVSTTLENKLEHLIPRDFEAGFNRTPSEPLGSRICVSPTIEQCIVAIPYHLGDTIAIYRTVNKVSAKAPEGVFDKNVTDEGWLEESTDFVKIGMLDFQLVETKLKIKNVIPPSASGDEPAYCGKVLKWWKKAKIKRFIEKT